MNDQVEIVYAEIVEEHVDLVNARPLEITLLISSGNEQLCIVVVITQFGVLQIAIDVKVNCNNTLDLLSARKPFN